MLINILLSGVLPAYPASIHYESADGYSEASKIAESMAATIGSL